MKNTQSSTYTKENKSAIITFRVTDSQKQELEQKSAEMSISVSAYLSHLLCDYENQKKECQQAQAKSIQTLTQLEIMEKAVLKAERDSQTVAHPAFTELFAVMNGKELNGKPIRSQYDLLGVLSLGAAITEAEGKSEVSIPVQVIQPVQEESALKLPGWIIPLAAISIGVLLVVLFFGLRRRHPMRY